MTHPPSQRERDVLRDVVGAKIVLRVPPQLMYEHENGARWAPTREQERAGERPAGYVYRHTVRPRELRRVLARVDRGGATTPIGETAVEWDEQLVLAMATTAPHRMRGWAPDIFDARADEGAAPYPPQRTMTLSEAILIASVACERCYNALCHAYGVLGEHGERRGYSVRSGEFASEPARCELCATPQQLNAVADRTGPGERFFPDARALTRGAAASAPAQLPQLEDEDDQAGLEGAPPAIADDTTPETRRAREDYQV